MSWSRSAGTRVSRFGVSHAPYMTVYCILMTVMCPCALLLFSLAALERSKFASIRHSSVLCSVVLERCARKFAVGMSLGVVVAASILPRLCMVLPRLFMA